MNLDFLEFEIGHNDMSSQCLVRKAAWEKSRSGLWCQQKLGSKSVLFYGHVALFLPRSLSSGNLLCHLENGQ